MVCHRLLKLNGLFLQTGHETSSEFELAIGYINTSTFQCISQFRNVNRDSSHYDNEVWRISSPTKLIKNATYDVSFITIGY